MSKAKAIEQLEHIRTLCGLELVDGNPGNQLAMECRMAATKAVRALGSEHDELGVAAAEPSAVPSAVSPSQTTEDAAAVPNAEEQPARSLPVNTMGKEFMNALGVTEYKPLLFSGPVETEDAAAVPNAGKGLYAAWTKVEFARYTKRRAELLDFGAGSYEGLMVDGQMEIWKLGTAVTNAQAMGEMDDRDFKPCYDLFKNEHERLAATSNAEPTTGSEAHASVVPDAFYQFGESIRTQDNLATAEPLFCVFQKERVYGLDPAYTEDIVWYDEESEADAATSKELEKQWQLDRREPGTWHRTGYKDVDRFVTACFTQDSAKAYILANQHNLKKPFIYVETLYRNPEMITLRQWLKSLRQPIFSGAVLNDGGELTTRDGVKYVRASDTPQMTCKSCGNPIEHNGKHRMHVGISPRHPAVPNMPVPEARRTPSWEKPVLGYFRKGGTKWMLVQVDGNSLTGYDIAPGGGVHTMHIARESVDAFVLINKD